METQKCFEDLRIIGSWVGKNYLRNIPGRPPPMRAIIFDILPIFFIIVCIWKNLFNIVFSSVTLTPLPDFSQAEFLQQFFHRQIVMRGHGFQHAFDQRAGF